MKIVVAGLAVLAVAGCGSSSNTIDNGHGQQMPLACQPAGDAINRINTMLDGVKAGTVTQTDAEGQLQKAGGDLATAVQIGTGKVQTDATDAQNAAGRLRVALVNGDTPAVSTETAAMISALGTLNADCP